MPRGKLQKPKKDLKHWEEIKFLSFFYVINPKKYIITEKDYRNKRRKYCNDCGGFVLVHTSFGNRYFCIICNGLIEEK